MRAFRSTSTCCFGLELLLSLAVVPGEPWAPRRAAAMLKQSEPTSSTLQLVASDMTGIMEKLDTHELDLDDGEYDTADTPAPGVLPLPQLARFPSASSHLSSSLLSCSRAPPPHRRLPHRRLQRARGQGLPVGPHHRQDPGGGALHLRPGPLLRHHAEEHQQGNPQLVCHSDLHIIRFLR